MGWAFCGEDSKGRPIGYGNDATCAHPGGCTKAIDRGLDYACGGMHGEDDPEGSCENYFCEEHRVYSEHAADGDGASVCHACAKALERPCSHVFEGGYCENCGAEEPTRG